MISPDASRSIALPAPPTEFAVSTTALFVDVDGTLVDFALRPDLVQLPPDVPGLLRRLNCALGGAFALLSGRSLGDLERLFGDLGDITIGALHGLVRRSADGRSVAIAPEQAIGRVRDLLDGLAQDLPGLLIEDKGMTIALHYRAHSELGPATIAAAEALVAIEGTNLGLLYGDHVVEIRPRGTDKGTALQAFLAEAPFHGRRPLMLGDDHTDEDAFAAATRLDGAGIVVGPRRPTCARYALPDPTAVRAWIGVLADAFEREILAR